MRFLKKILFIVMIGVLGIFQVNTSFSMERRLEIPRCTNCSEDSDFYIIKIDSETKICFPKNGKQPTSENAAKYSCASSKNDKVTAWYIWAFGGISALSAVYAENQHFTGFPTFSLWGFSSSRKSGEKVVAQTSRCNIIVLSVNSNYSDKKLFWKTFKKIAETPVGRVLLYRLLIEINRVIIKTGELPKYNYVENYCGVPEILVLKRMIEDINERNNCRSLEVKLDSQTSESGFSHEERKVLLGTKSVDLTILVRNHDHIVPTITTQLEPADLDIVLFHEMLHWFHFLRDPVLYKEKGPINFLNYAVLSYYGDLSELFVWGINSSFDAEEIKTILGTPDWKDDRVSDFICHNAILCKNKKYLEGDDLSENAYRISRNIETPSNYKIRFGHTDMQIPKFYFWLSDQSFPMNRFVLAYMCAILAARRASCLAE